MNTPQWWDSFCGMAVEYVPGLYALWCAFRRAIPFLLLGIGLAVLLTFLFTRP